MIVRFLAAASLVALFAATAHAVYQDGIDVSHFQGAIDWTSVKNAGTTFAFTKATEGVGFTDSTFVTNMSGAAGAGVIIGPYHLARPDSSNTDINDAANEAN